MNFDFKNMDQYSDEEFLNSLPGVDMPYSKSKDEVWTEMFSEIKDEQKPKKKTRRLWVIYSAAALVLLLISTTAFMRFYTESVICPRGEHLSFLLPDNSRVELNANSNLTYHPYWWQFSRQVEFEGKRFLISVRGTVLILFPDMG